MSSLLPHMIPLSVCLPCLLLPRLRLLPLLLLLPWRHRWRSRLSRSAEAAVAWRAARPAAAASRRAVASRARWAAAASRRAAASRARWAAAAPRRAAAVQRALLPPRVVGRRRTSMPRWSGRSPWPHVVEDCGFVVEESAGPTLSAPSWRVEEPAWHTGRSETRTAPVSLCHPLRLLPRHSCGAGCESLHRGPAQGRSAARSGRRGRGRPAPSSTARVRATGVRRDRDARRGA